MPTLFIIAGLRFFFYLGDYEPIHIHVESTHGLAKFTLVPQIELVYNKGLTKTEINNALKSIKENKEIIIERWQELIQ